MKGNLGILTALAIASLGTDNNSFSRPRYEVNGKAIPFPKEQPKLSKKAKAKQKNKNQ